jgi:hypothetical protein
MNITTRTQLEITAEARCVECRKTTAQVNLCVEPIKGRQAQRYVNDELKRLGWTTPHKGPTCPKCSEPPPLKPREPSAVDLTEAKRLKAAGWSFAKLGERYGVSRQRVEAALRMAAAD